MAWAKRRHRATDEDLEADEISTGSRGDGQGGFGVMSLDNHAEAQFRHLCL